MRKKLRLFKIFHIRDKAILKGRREQKKLDEKLIAKIRQECEEEKVKAREEAKQEGLNKINELKNKMTELQKEHADELASIREQERNKFEPRLSDLRNEVFRLNEEYNKKKSHYNSILQYGIMMERTGEKAIDKFNRASLKLQDFMNYLKTAEQIFGEVVKLIDSGQSDVESAQYVIEKEKPQLLKGLEE